MIQVKYKPTALIVGIQIPIYALLLFILSGCFSVKPATTKSTKNNVVTFYIGEEGTQYFIKPLLFLEDVVDSELFADIAFRYKDEVKDAAIVNFTIKSRAIYKHLDSVKISNPIIDITNNKIELLFNEKNKSNFISRFTMKIPLTDIKQLFANNEWNFEVYSGKQHHSYKPHKKTKKKIDAIRDNVFIIMNN